MVNERIRFREVMVIGPEGEKFGVMSRNEALDKAEDYGLDLLCVSPGAKPPVCKILDYGRHRYEQQKRAREARKKQHVTQIKGIRLSPVIEEHDFNTKLRHARKWLEEGSKVKVDMRFRGRLITRVEVGKKTMNRFLDETKDLGSAERRPKLEGNTMSVMISPNKNK
ncbi:MAG TPA: translation initiation factor IF-3 [Erysipelothrix sp.]|nr:translation initiation factor IF-3 [Erysipelothrix sp.]